MKQVPLMVVGDAPDLPSGLARIGRDLADRLCTMPEFDVAYLGLGGVGCRATPYRQFNIQEQGSYSIWGQRCLGPAWRSHSLNRTGAVFSVWDPMRCGYIGLPSVFAPEKLQEFIAQNKFKRWGYFAVDAFSPFGRFSGIIRDILAGYDRRLFYSKWAWDIAQRSRIPGDWLPHGISDVWQPKDPRKARHLLGIPEDALLIGCVSTNQPRKDWGLTFDVISMMRRAKIDVYLWAHVDTFKREGKEYTWDLNAMTADFGLQGRVLTTTYKNDEDLADFYSACDATFANGMGEGFGYPIAESLACGTPVVHCNYGGGAELIPEEYRVQPAAMRFYGPINEVRPVLNSQDVMDKLLMAAQQKKVGGGDVFVSLVEHLRWSNLWPAWEKWFRAGYEEEWG